MAPEDDHCRQSGTEQSPHSDDSPSRGSNGLDSAPSDAERDQIRSDGGNPTDESPPSWKGGDRSSTGGAGDGEGDQSKTDGWRDGETRDWHESEAGNDHRNGMDPEGAPDIAELQREVVRLRSQLDEFEEDIESRTVERPKLRAELRRYVRRQMRRGHARGWGPYLVLLYGTVGTLGAFYWLNGIYAIGAMIILGLSTLGLYVLFILFGIGLNVAGVPFRAIDAYRRRRE